MFLAAIGVAGIAAEVRTETPAELAVAISGEFDVCGPAATVQATVKVALPDVPDGTRLHFAVTPIRGDETLWQSHESCPNPGENTPIELSFEAPAREGAYRLQVVAEPPRRLGDHLRPFHAVAPLASAQAEFVVVDPDARLPLLTDQWMLEATVDPTHESWRQRLPAWMLPPDWRPADDGAIACGATSVRSVAEAELLEVAPPEPGQSAWVAVRLPVRRPGMPHAVEFALPADQATSVAVAVLEADDSGGTRILTSTGVGALSGEPGALASHRVAFWPRTREPVVVVACHDADASLQLGQVRVYRREVADAAVETPGNSSPQTPNTERLALAYMPSPALWSDAVDGEHWAAGLHAIQQLAQTVRANGFNGAAVCFPQDDVIAGHLLETAARVFDREGLTLVPVINLQGELPALNAFADGAQAAENGLYCVNAQGRTVAGDDAQQADRGPVYSLLNSQVQQALTQRVSAVAQACAGHDCYGGVALRLDGAGYGVLPGIAWCLDDATIERFCAESGVDLAAGSGDRFRRRAEQLLGPHRAAWVTWRNNQVAGVYRRLVSELPSGRSGVRAMFCIENITTGAAAQLRLRQALAGKCSVLDATDEAAIDLRALAQIDGAVLLRPQRRAGPSRLSSVSLDRLITDSASMDDALAGVDNVGESLYWPAHPMVLSDGAARLDGVLAGAPATLPGPITSGGDAAREPITAALARRDCPILLVGGDQWPSGIEAESRAAIAAFAQLPAACDDKRVERAQPVTMRVYRTATTTTICVVNPTQWSAEIQLPMTVDAPAAWKLLGATVDAADEQLQGTLPRGESSWSRKLPPFGIAAWQWQSPHLRLGVLAATADTAASEQLQQELAEVEQRMTQLNERRSFDALANAGFEETPTAETWVGWQPRVGARGQVAVDRLRACSGAASLHLVSADLVGAAVQSLEFTAPPTGRLTLAARVQTLNFHPDARLYAAVEFDVDGQTMRRYRPVLAGDTGGKWETCELIVDDLPLAPVPVRVQFHLTGAGEAWIDDVQLFDVWFTNTERIDLAKRFFAAKLALEEGKLTDCQQMLAGYWPQHLLEHVPGANVLDAEHPRDLRIAESPTTPSNSDGEAPQAERPLERRRLTDRIRDWAPKLWR
ncbi:MAG: hypothetical protein CMJ58_18175 [Planctomycetaceae bacterium]|nr:hypothetical protein [Planctomycetaceae bacterium]